MNLIVTCSRHLEREACEEIQKFLEDMDDHACRTTDTGISGIITVDTSIDPTYVTQEIRSRLIEEPWSVRYCLRIIPVQRLVNSTMQDIVLEVSSLAENINESETYRITVEKRNSDISSRELITKIAAKINNKVSLELPDKIILIEILGRHTGVSILRPADILSVTKTKINMSE